MCPASIPLLDLEGAWLMFSSDFEALSMALYDTRTLKDGRSLRYVMDGYDFCLWFFPPGAFQGKQNPHHPAIRAAWETFLELCDGERMSAVLSPFTLVEFAATVAERVSDKEFRDKLSGQMPEIDAVLSAIQRGEAQLGSLPRAEVIVLRELYAEMRKLKRAADVMSGSELFDSLAERVQAGRIRLLDPLIPDSVPRTALFEADRARAAAALRYLRARRKKMRPEHNELYSALDVYHFVTVENSRRALASQDIVPHLTSSGILSRNSWYMMRYGHIPHDTLSVPSDWNVRAGNAPGTLARVIQSEDGNLDAVDQFFEEARCLVRVILRDLLSLPQVRACRRSAKQRVVLYEENPLIRVPAATVHMISRFQNDYRRHAMPDEEQQGTPLVDAVEAGFDVQELLDFIRKPSSRKEIYTTSAERFAEEVQALNLSPRNWSTYVAPLGRSSYELLRTFAGDMGLDL